MCYFHQGGKVENITKILIAFEGESGKAVPFFFFFFQPTVFILPDVGMQNEAAEAHNAAIHDRGKGLFWKR